MDYRRLGKAGVKVSRLCLGTGVRGPLDEAQLTRAIERAVDLGCNFIDCANNYGRGGSEIVLGKAIRGKRDDLVITSKVWTPVSDGPNDRGLSRFHILREVERSLVKLGTDRIDIYYMHRVDPETDLDETLRNVIRAFSERGLEAPKRGSRRPDKPHPAFDAEQREALRALLQRNPREFDKPSSL